MGKKSKSNKFSEFMYEFIAREKAAGRTYPQSEWAKVAGEPWEKLSEAEKAKYDEKAKAKMAGGNAKGACGGSGAGGQNTGAKPKQPIQSPKYTSFGERVDVVERKNREKFENEKYMERTIKSFVRNTLENHELATKPLYFIMANYFYAMPGDTYYSPAELAIGRFTMENGIDKSYHTDINPGYVECGYAFEARDRSERTHRLPPPPNAGGEENFHRIYRNILDVLGIQENQMFDRADKNRPFVVIQSKYRKMMEIMLDDLAKPIEWRKQFDVFDVETLFYELKNETEHDPDYPNNRLSIFVTNKMVEDDPFDLTPGISCAFHENIDATKYCALSFLYRWFYLLVDHVAEKNGIKLVPGWNLPSNVRF